MATYDTIIIGAGSGGAACAYALAAGGQRVAVVEQERVGGECAFWACVPSKVLLRSSAPNAQSLRTPGSRAARRGGPDFGEAAAWRTESVDNYNDLDHATQLREAGATLLRGAAAIVAAGRVRVGDVEHTAAAIVIATGSSDKIPALAGLSDDRPYHRAHARYRPREHGRPPRRKGRDRHRRALPGRWRRVRNRRCHRHRAAHARREISGPHRRRNDPRQHRAGTL